MRLQDTPEMTKLWKIIEPYLEKGKLKENVPENIKKALEEYRRLGKEQWNFAESL